MRRISVDPRVGPRGRAGPESDSEGEEEFQDSREDPPPMDPMGPPPVPNLGWARSTLEGHPNVAVQGEGPLSSQEGGRHD